jgi:hypothetical protein
MASHIISKHPEANAMSHPQRHRSCRALTLPLLVTLTAGLGHLSAQAQQAQQATDAALWPEDLTVVLGAKMWSHHWTSWSVSNAAYNLASRQLIVPQESSDSVALIPQLTVLYKDVTASMSAMASTKYKMKEQWASGSTDSTRSEFDLNAGYVLTPGLTASVGYKKLNQNFGGKFSWAGPTVGLSGSAPLGHGLSVYGALGLGALNAKLPNADAAGQTSLKAGYVLSEAGLAYALQDWHPPLARSLVFTAGYRSQTMTTRNYTLLDTNLPNKTSKQDVRDATQGLTLSAVLAF